MRSCEAGSLEFPVPSGPVPTWAPIQPHHKLITMLERYTGECMVSLQNIKEPTQTHQDYMYQSYFHTWWVSQDENVFVYPNHDSS